MKRARLFLIVLAGVLSAAAAIAATVTVLVQQTQIRKRPQFYAPSVGVAKLGEKFEASGPQQGWYKVAGDTPGWIHQSAVTAKKVKLGSGSSVGENETTADEVTLAGKGFNEQVEKSYQSEHSEANFAAVNAMETRVVGDAAILQFMRSGGLTPQAADQ